MIRLLALAADDGWAFVQDSGRTYLVRPPYYRDDLLEVEPHAVEKAVSKHGFHVLVADLRDWRELVSFLNEKVAASGRVAEDESGLSVGQQMLELAPPEVLGNLLSRVENELLPCGGWDHALRLLAGMLRIPAVCDDRALDRRVHELVDAALALKATAEEAKTKSRGEILNVQAISPKANQRYGLENVTALTRDVIHRRQVFGFDR
ncbi:MAG: hypothetical protein FJ272_03305 [Planctomycetes bacterium]|nr:hypothetical protein [Planctomycetota bacterium]